MEHEGVPGKARIGKRKRSPQRAPSTVAAQLAVLWSDENGGDILEAYGSAIIFCHRHEIHVTQRADPPPMGQIGVQCIRELTQRSGEKNVVLAIEISGRHLLREWTRLRTTLLGRLK